MTQDIKPDVQTQGQASQGASPETEPAAKPETQPQAADKPSIDPTVQAAIEAAIAKAMNPLKEAGRRELQSQQDRNRAETERYARQARYGQTVLDETYKQAQSLDPEAAEKLELARLRAERQSRQQLDQEDRATQEQEAFNNQFYTQMTQLVQSMGVDTNHKDIDWGQDAGNYFEAQRRIMESAQKIQRINYDSSIETIKSQLKAVEDKLKAANIEVNSVPAGTPQTSVSGSDQEFLQKFGSGEILLTKANLERYNKIINSE